MKNLCKQCQEKPADEVLKGLCWSCEHKNRLSSLPEEIHTKAVKAIQKELPEEVKQDIRHNMLKRPDSWWAPYHFSWGMAMRNFLRNNVCLDDKLPSHNWDDYYVPLIEEAIGAEPTRFTRVNLEHELRADTDGMPVFRRCLNNEVLLSFYDDLGAQAFEEWWEEQGADLLGAWCSNTPVYQRLVK